MLYVFRKNLYGSEYKDDIMSYTFDIAKHNMWIADEEHIDVYKNFGLFELIPQLDNSHRVSFAKSPLLFLLCLLDTVEPIKTNSDKSKMSEKVLKDCVVKVEKQSNQVKLQFGNKTMWKKVKGCEDWLDIKLSGNSVVEFNIK